MATSKNSAAEFVGGIAVVFTDVVESRSMLKSTGATKKSTSKSFKTFGYFSKAHKNIRLIVDRKGLRIPCSQKLGPPIQARA